MAEGRPGFMAAGYSERRQDGEPQRWVAEKRSDEGLSGTRKVKSWRFMPRAVRPLKFFPPEGHQGVSFAGAAAWQGPYHNTLPGALRCWPRAGPASGSNRNSALSD